MCQSRNRNCDNINFLPTRPIEYKREAPRPQGNKGQMQKGFGTVSWIIETQGVKIEETSATVEHSIFVVVTACQAEHNLHNKLSLPPTRTLALCVETADTKCTPPRKTSWINHLKTQTGKRIVFIKLETYQKFSIHVISETNSSKGMTFSLVLREAPSETHLFNLPTHSHPRHMVREAQMGNDSGLL